MSGEIQRKSVDLAQLRAGVQLRTGQRYLLVVKNVKGRNGAGDGFVLEVQLHAAGGTPLANERVRIHDPDTGEPVGAAAV
ncbi:MAG TPA: hypothetical protein VE964_16535, partial [Myxococcales bacterium]|nr:hypothetical protein [Myxococcales bacterium]